MSNNSNNNNNNNNNNNKPKIDITKEPTESLYRIFHANVKAKDVYAEMAEKSRRTAIEIDTELTKRADSEQKAKLARETLLATNATKK